MSSRNPIDLRQDRRQWLKTSATMLGATLVPVSATSSEIEQTFAKSVAPPPHAHEEKAARFFTPEQYALVEELSETIIPADSHSGGAKAARVADHIEKTLRETRDDSQKLLWREALPLIDSMSRHYNGKAFVNASPEERVAVLTVLSDNPHMDDIVEVRFFKALKHLTVQGYYTSKIGIHDDLQYKGNRILKEYVGCDDQGAANP
jgi:glucoside 3-dehydrogenase (cytochrome c) hitch-hiker subunit